MVSDVSICNMALTRLGQSIIASLDQRGVEAALCKMYYEPTVKELLSAQNWSFAIEKEQLGVSGDVNLTPYTYMYNLPAKFIHIVSVLNNETFEESKDYWKIEGKKILTNVNPLYIKYVKYVDNPNEFPQTFIEALYLRIATKLCLKLTQDQSLLGFVYQEYSAAMLTAMGRDNTGSEKQPETDTLWSS